jgi:hypothetical protein
VRSSDIPLHRDDTSRAAFSGENQVLHRYGARVPRVANF